MKDLGIYQKYEIKKLKNPSWNGRAIVLEFDDPIARKGIKAWAEEMRENGYYKVFDETMILLENYELKDKLKEAESYKYKIEKVNIEIADTRSYLSYSKNTNEDHVRTLDRISLILEGKTPKRRAPKKLPTRLPPRLPTDLF